MPTAAGHEVPPPLENPDAYRPVSTLAIVAAVAGVASLVVLISPEPPLWAIPASAIAVALAALRQIARSNPPLVGRPLARLGLGLGVAMLVAGPVNRVTRLAWAEREAAAVAQQWIEYLRKGHRRAAHQLSLPLAARCPSDQTLSHCYRNEPDRQEQLDAYLARRDIRQLLLWGEQATYRDPAALFRSFRGLSDEVDLVYRIDLARDDDPHDHHRSLRVLLRRQRDETTGAFYWMVAAVKLVDSAAP